MNDKALVNWDEELAKEAKEIASRERPSVAQIGTRAGVMMYQGQQVPGNKLTCIIISSATEQRYDTKPFDPQAISPPDCFALSLSGEHMIPDPVVKEPQSERCEICPQFGWQPNPKRPGKNHKPCKERRRLALLPADAIQKGNIKTAEVAVLALPVTSVKYWGTYVNAMAAQHGKPPWALLTEISLRPHPQNQFEVNFTNVGLIPTELLAEVRDRITQGNEVLLTPYDMSGLMVPGSDPMKPAKDRKF
jgi:hypothetical protein